MKGVCVAISIVCLWTSVCAPPCCPNAKIYYAKYEPDVYLRSVETQHYSREEVERAIADSIASAWSVSQRKLEGLEGEQDEEQPEAAAAPAGVLQSSKCLNDRVNFKTWDGPAAGNFWEMRGSYPEMQFTRFAVDMLKLGTDIYWGVHGDDGVVPERQRVIALYTETKGVFSRDWSTGEINDATNICQDGVMWNAADLIDTLKDLNGWFVIIASDLDVMGTWAAWFRDVWEPMATAECGNGCRLSVVQSTGNALYDIQKGMEMIDFGHNPYKSCVACKYVPTTPVVATNNTAVVGPPMPSAEGTESSGAFSPVVCLFYLILFFAV